MKLHGSTVLLTGAGGGIGAATALALAERGARLTLAGRHRQPLVDLADRIAGLYGDRPQVAIADLATREGCADLIAQATRDEPVDILINNAGTQAIGDFADEPATAIESAVAINLLAPLTLTRHLLPRMRARRRGCVVNIGSAFGSIGFPCYTTYSATKFALRGFSEALRRELAGSGVEVCYVAPRATRTSMTDEELAKRCRMHLDAPEDVAAILVRAIERGRPETYVGFPEKLFVRLNALVPRLIDGGLRRQHEQLRHYLHQTAHQD